MTLIFSSLFLAISIAALVLYVACISVLHESYAESIVDFRAVAGMTLAAFILTFVVGSWSGRRRRRVSHLLTLGTSICILTVCLLFADWFHARWTGRNQQGTYAARLYDANRVPGELHPHIYYPTKRNMRLHKPSVALQGSHYGAFYHPDMLSVPALATGVLSLKDVDIKIDEFGLRNNFHPRETNTFVLGDSITFGWGVAHADSWPELITTQYNQPVYNLGVIDGSPRHQFEALNYLLNEYPDAFMPQKVVWVIYEGNDLEDDYHPLNPGARRAEVSIGQRYGRWLSRLPEKIKNQSIVTRYRFGEFTLAIDGQDDAHPPGGFSSPWPYYTSASLGPRLFYPDYVRRAGLPSVYVRSHSNRRSVNVVFKAMQALAEKHGFDVLVTVVPTAARVHGRQFDQFPEISAQPHVINMFQTRALQAGFDYLDLLPTFESAGQSRLLYFRDDDHLNVFGNVVLAKQIAQALLPANE